MKIWTSTEKGNEKIIAYIDQTIYIGNPKLSELDAYVFDMGIKKTPTKHIIGIPHHYLKEINLQEGKRYIEVLFGADSYQHLRITDDTRRAEIFDYLKSNVPNIVTSVDKYSPIRAGKKPLIAGIIILLFFIWTLSIAASIEKGADYEVVGHQGSMAQLVLVIAYLGVKKTIIIFTALLAIAVSSFVMKAKNPPVITRLNVQR